MMRMTRASVLAVMASPYIEMAILKGLTKSRIVVRHALPNALAPIINVIALDLAYLIVGVVVVEAVFVYPGLGQLMVDAVSKHDVPVVQACGLIFAATFILLNMTADILAICPIRACGSRADANGFGRRRSGRRTGETGAARHSGHLVVRHQAQPAGADRARDRRDQSVRGAMFAPLDRAVRSGDAGRRPWADPDSHHWLGLDNLGRDLFSRLIYGARLSIGLTLVITALSFAIGIITGFAAAVAGGWVDLALSRLVDLMLSMPTLIFAFVVLSVLGTAMPVLIVTIALLDAPKVFRLARAVAMGFVNLEFVEAARLRGEGWWWIIRAKSCPTRWRRSPPNSACASASPSCSSRRSASSASACSRPPPTGAAWSATTSDMIDYGSIAPIYPAGAIAILTIGVNFVVDWMLAVHSRGQGEGA
jgi:peptide/nickel transport system permease protein